MTLWCIVLLVLLVWQCDALRSCTKNGQVRVPCQDELVLGKSDKFLLTLYGHTCYTMNVVAPEPLEVSFYESRDLKSDKNVRQLQDANETVEVLEVLGDNECHNVLSCVQLQEGLSKVTVYNLMISRWANASDEDLEEENAPIKVTLELQHCDPVSPWHYVGLVFVGGIGFTSTILLLCIVGEFVFGLRTITKLQNAAKHERFVELAQIDPLQEKKSEKEHEESEEDSEEPTAPLMTTEDSEGTEKSPA
ncbi:hypothetical protein PHMEG_00019660 [Phytophthora megakarya]|uniref:Uncharacterized protein n=1 Tax=Phytophthora megakarya TaxID=4795 RepID=A0A225VRV7_9STRA|nr:hypothetical protein PHMEG_00019660 [Phytophthora megakarya]